MTHLKDWLDANGKTIVGLSRETGVAKDSLYRLATPGAQKWMESARGFRADVLETISKATGIPPGQLIEDAMEWESANGRAAAADG